MFIVNNIYQELIMANQNDTVCCTIDKGEIFPGAVLKEKYSAKDQAYKTIKAKYIRKCHQEMLENYNNTH